MTRDGPVRCLGPLSDTETRREMLKLQEQVCLVDDHVACRPVCHAPITRVHNNAPCQLALAREGEKERSLIFSMCE